MKRALIIFGCLTSFFVFLKADISFDSVKGVLKRKFDDSAFEDDANIAENSTFKAVISSVNGKEQLKTMLSQKFKSETAEYDYRSISEYEIENFPKYVTIFSDVWDEQALEELRIALPLLKFIKKCTDWKPFPGKSRRSNILIINRKSINDEILNKIYEHTGQDLSTIKKTDFKRVGWPQGVSICMSRWDLKDILAIYRHLKFMKFIPSKKLRINEVVFNRAFDLHNKIMEAFEQMTKESRDLFRKYQFKPWPKCVPQLFKYWDEESIDEIEKILPKMEFFLKAPDWKLDQEHFDIDCLILQGEIYDSLLQAMNTQLDTQLFQIPWKDINISGWPEGIPIDSNLMSPADILRLYRALPRMEFKWKIDDSKNENVILTQFFSDSNIQNGVNFCGEYFSVVDILDGFELYLEDCNNDIPEMRAEHSKSFEMPSEDDVLDDLYNCLTFELNQSSQNDYLIQDYHNKQKYYT